MSICRVGTSGWTYRHWRTVFYPDDLPQRSWLGHYATRCDTVEVNTTFYGLPKPETLRHWAEAVPEDFRFAVKVSRYMTHMKRLTGFTARCSMASSALRCSSWRSWSHQRPLP